MHFDFGSVLVFVGLAAVFLAATLALGRLVRPATPDRRKGLVYECGETPLGPSWFNFNPRFYLIALVFLIFDVEVAFTYPVAAVFRRWVRGGEGARAGLEIALFLLVLLAGLVYVLGRRDLTLTWVAAGPEEPVDDAEGPNAAGGTASAPIAAERYASASEPGA
jgi:NADH-quinone oxidoreductase subunit A